MFSDFALLSWEQLPFRFKDSDLILLEFGDSDIVGLGLLELFLDSFENIRSFRFGGCEELQTLLSLSQ
jgi:hypothetical protein